MFSTEGKNAMLDAIGITHVGAFTDFPADSGAGSNEVSGGSYARQAISYAAASGGQKTKAAGTVTIPIPGGTTVYFIGGFSALTAGSWRKIAPVNGGSVFGIGIVAAGDDVIRSYDHGLADDDRVRLVRAGDAALPAPASATALYHVVESADDSFKVSLTQGGAAINFTGDGELMFQKVIGEYSAVDFSITVNTDTLSLNA